MSFISNNKGVSLVETLVALGITAVAGVAYMTHMQTVAKNDARQKIRASMDTLTAEANNYLQSRDICQENVGEAFHNVALVGLEKDGRPGYRSLKNKGYRDASGNIVQKDIFKTGDIFDGGRIHVRSVNYKVTELTNVTIPSSPWTKSGKINISVDFETCRNNGPVVTKNAAGVLVDVCPINQRSVVSKNFTKLAAFKTNSSNIIMTQTINGVTKKRLACADSQDALVEEAQNYTDLKVCLSEFRMMLMSGKVGTTSCNLKIVPTATNKKTINYSPSQQSLNLVGNYIFTSSLNFMLVSGAGGGGFGGADGHGGPGGAGKVRKIKGSEIPSTNFKNCKLAIGNGGAGVGQGGEPNGGATTLLCPGAPNVVIEGGNRGADKISTASNCGRSGEQLVIDGVSYGSPGGGRCRKSSSGSNGTMGSGGGGGAYGANTSGWRKDGTPGGPGFAIIEYRGFNIEDPENVLDALGTDVAEVLGGMGDSVIVNN